ncbi:LacI family DNA-binding transcriptional regulator [Loktanella sp. SALINAS62]|uniref:LacI family DNA-binding transcriptional regulator n=1 Tax=Loktanella sp. SALINAS62 TaxID=2706124 RepID=UPI0032C436BA
MDVATRAGVSYATVDRVINGRGSVAEKSRTTVMRAVADLGYVRNVAAANLSQRRVYRFCFVIPEGTNAFFDRVCKIVGAVSPPDGTDRVQIRVERVAAFDAAALAKCLIELSDADLDGIAIVGINDARIDTPIAIMRDKGIAVLAMISDMPESLCDGYIGINNTTAGATAGGLIALSHGGRPGRVLPIVGALTARDHAERIDGFRKTLAATALTIAPLIEGRDRHDLVETHLRAALVADPAITAIYSAGAGNAGLIRVLATLPSDRPRPMVVLHELLPHSRDALEQGLIDIVIDQRPEEEVRRTLALLRCLADRRPLPAARQIVPAIYIRQNLPAEVDPALLEGSAA